MQRSTFCAWASKTFGSSSVPWGCTALKPRCFSPGSSHQVGGVEIGLIGRQRAPNIICIPAAQGDAHNIRPVLVKPERKLDAARHAKILVDQRHLECMRAQLHLRLFNARTGDNARADAGQHTVYPKRFVVNQQNVQTGEELFYIHMPSSAGAGADCLFASTRLVLSSPDHTTDRHRKILVTNGPGPPNV